MERTHRAPCGRRRPVSWRNAVRVTPDPSGSVSKDVTTSASEIRRIEISCACCGEITTGGGLCPHHDLGYADDWATSNRIMCDFIHRGIAVPVAGARVLLETS